jgi:hypothetical protein
VPDAVAVHAGHRRGPVPAAVLREPGADVVEVAPTYDHADITSVAASHLAYDLVSLLALKEGV